VYSTFNLDVVGVGVGVAGVGVGVAGVGVGVAGVGVGVVGVGVGLVPQLGLKVIVYTGDVPAGAGIIEAPLVDVRLLRSGSTAGTVSTPGNPPAKQLPDKQVNLICLVILVPTVNFSMLVIVYLPL